ncbi:MAG: hypothetical protein IT529_08675 [Burkholderiales bacterium]|nr:hypothetical protein [Burkholderiales bacterium]
MTQQHRPAEAPAGETGVRFTQMSPRDKLKHVCKIFIFFLTFGFVFPGIFSD